jgi:AcrR family transcriptional regulator
VSPRPGRRPGDSGTRQEILRAAHAAFAEHGYDKASVRAIARDAGVDPALVHHFFGTKQKLFGAVLDLPVDPPAVVAAILDGDPATAGSRMAHTFLGVWDAPGGRSPFVALIRSAASSTPAAAMLRELVAREILAPVMAGLGVDEPDRRAALVASQMIGVAFVRYVLAMEPVASAAIPALAADIAPAMQHHLTGELEG